MERQQVGFKVLQRKLIWKRLEFDGVEIEG